MTVNAAGGPGPLTVNSESGGLGIQQPAAQAWPRQAAKPKPRATERWPGGPVGHRSPGPAARRRAFKAWPTVRLPVTVSQLDRHSDS